jgi:hypothetical protein
MRRFVGRWFFVGYCAFFLSFHVSDAMQGRADWGFMVLWTLLLVVNMALAIGAQVRDGGRVTRDPKG